MITFDANLLTSYYQSRFATTGKSATPLAGGAKTKLPTPPWDPRMAAPVNELTKRALLGAKFIDLSAARLDVKGPSEDYRKLFTLYQGLSTLQAIAQRSEQSGLQLAELGRVRSAFNRGLAEIVDFVDGLKLDDARLVRGSVSDRLRAEGGVRKDKYEYLTQAIHTGLATDEVAGMQGDVKFNIAIKKFSSTIDVAIDLAEMGATPRTMANVANFVNGKLTDAGVNTRISSYKLPNEPRTVQAGGKTVTLPATADRWALKIRGDSGEAVSFSAPATAAAVYLAQSSGKTPTSQQLASGQTDKTERQILKFQADTTAAPALNANGDRIGSAVMGAEVAAIRATASGPDGSLYVLADVTGDTSGQMIQGQRDVALMKYDSAGNLLYTRTLGAGDAASGYALSVSADGKVAIAGSVTGEMGGVVEGPVNSAKGSGKADSFVTLFNPEGEEMWTVRRGATEDDVAQAVAFGEDGTVYVAGRTRSAMVGGAPVGGWDNYLTAFATQADGKPKALFTQQFGSVGDDKVGGIAVNGDQIVVAGTENGAAVVRSFDVTATTVTTDRVTSGGVLTMTVTTKVDGAVTDAHSTDYATGGADSASSVSITTAAALTAGTVRNLGLLEGGEVAGVAFRGADVIVAGTSTSGMLSGGTVTTAHSGGTDAFIVKMSSALTPAGSDRITYFGGDGADTASAVTVSGGEVWIAGATSSTSLAGDGKLGTRDGYVARIDADTGEVNWSSRFSGKEGEASPTSIAVDASGASVLDRLGLPKGTLDYKDSQLLTAGTSLRPGDQFFVRVREGALPTAITIEAKDTLQTLAAKVRRATGFHAKVEVVTDNGYSKLQIRPMSERSLVEVIAGKGGKDALDSLGLTEGVARVTGGSADKDKKIYGLQLSNELNLDTKDAVKIALQQIGDALSRIRMVYRDLEKALNPQPVTSKPAHGPVPAYLQAQLANYQAGLNRLMGGG